MKIKRTLKRAIALLICVATVLTTFDVTALTTKATSYYGDDVTISGNDILNITGDDLSSISNDDITVSDNDTEDEDASISENDPSDNDEDASVSDNDADSDVEDESASDNDIDSVSDNSVSDNSVSDNSISDNSISDNSISENEISESEKWGGAEVLVNLETKKPESVSLNCPSLIVTFDGQEEYLAFDHSDSNDTDYDEEVTYSDTDSFTIEYTYIDEDTVSVKIDFDLRMRPLYIEDGEGSSLYDSENNFDNEDLLEHLNIEKIEAEDTDDPISFVVSQIIVFL